jgi:hypothetical protein
MIHFIIGPKLALLLFPVLLGWWWWDGQQDWVHQSAAVLATIMRPPDLTWRLTSSFISSSEALDLWDMAWTAEELDWLKLSNSFFRTAVSLQMLILLPGEPTCPGPPDEHQRKYLSGGGRGIFLCAMWTIVLSLGMTMFLQGRGHGLTISASLALHRACYMLGPSNYQCDESIIKKYWMQISKSPS